MDGWEPSIVLQKSSQPKALPTLHPLLVASFQLTFSVFALMAFPGPRSRAEEREAAVVGTHLVESRESRVESRKS